MARHDVDEAIRRLLGELEESYPPERVARIKGQSEAAWKGCGEDSPYAGRIAFAVFGGLPPGRAGIPDGASPEDAELIAQLAQMRHNAEVAGEHFKAFHSGLEQVTVPSMFMCVKEGIGASEHIRPVIASPEDVYRLPEARVRDGYMCKAILDRMAYRHGRTGGRVWSYMTDVQGPFSCAAQMWGIERFLADLREHPKEAHHLLGLCTDAIIAFFAEMRRAVGGRLVPIHCMPVIWVPEDCGVAVSDDFFAIVGADVAEEFSIPYLERIGEALGGVTVHTCGSMNHLASSVNAMRHIKAVNFSVTETDLDRYADECDPRIAIIAHKSGVSIGGLPIPDDIGLIRLCAATQRRTGVRVIALPQYVEGPITPERNEAWERAASLSGP